MAATIESILFMIRNRHPFTEKDALAWTIIYGSDTPIERQAFATETEAKEAALFAAIKYPNLRLYSPAEVERLIKLKQEHDQNNFRTLDNDVK